MNLADYLHLRTPIVWVNTDEPGRVIDNIVALETEREVYRYDTLAGLLLHSESGWLRVLGPNPMTGQDQPIMDLAEGMMKAVASHGIMILDNAHLLAQGLMGVFSSLGYSFRKAFWDDDLDLIPAQFLLLSCQDKLPDELARLGAVVTHDLPDGQEIKRITSHIAVCKNITVGSEELEKIARASLGMSEMEFIEAALIGLRDSGSFDHEALAKNKLDRLKKGNLLEVTQPLLTIADLGGLDLAKDMIESIGWSWSNPARSVELKVKPTNAVLLVGVPGSGKSLLCEATAGVLGVDLAKGGISNAMDSFVGKSEQNMRRMFQSLKAMAPIVFWIDEFGRDASGGQSSGRVDAGTTDRVHGAFLTGLQERPDNVFLMCAANHIDQLPPEMTRAGRFDIIMFVGMPTTKERAEIFKIHLGDEHENHDLMKLAEATAYFTGAEIQTLIQKTRGPIAFKHDRPITTEDLMEKAPLFKNRVWIKNRPEIISMYNRAVSDWEWASSGQQAEAEKVIAAAMQPIPQYGGPKATQQKTGAAW